MPVRVLTYGRSGWKGRALEEIVDVLESGGIIGYPTETVYGLGADASNPGSIERIHRLKGRKVKSPMLVLVGDASALEPLVKHVPETAMSLMSKFWPGPLTLLFEASESVPDCLTGGLKTVGIRISPDPICRSLLGRYRKPLVSTSANKTGMPPARSAQEVASRFPDGVRVVIDGGRREESHPSTILDVTVDPPRLVRSGCIPEAELLHVLGKNDAA